MAKHTPPTDLQIPAFSVRQALVGMEMQSADEPILRYLDLWSRQVQIESAYFLHVVPDFSSFTPFPEEVRPPLLPDYEIGEQILQSMEKQIAETLTEKERIYVEYEVVEGDPLEELLLAAGDQAADLVVIGQRAQVERHRIQARNLVREAHGNVLIVPEQARMQLSSVLVPVDFSAHSIRSYQTALALARQFGDSLDIHLVHVYELPDLSVYKVSKTPAQFQKMVEENRQEALELFLDSYTPAALRKRVKARLVRKDLPGVAGYLHDYSQEQGVDLVVMGAKGHSKVELLLLGSVTEHFLGINSRVPTLVVK